MTFPNDTFTGIKANIIKELIDTDPEFKEQLSKYGEICEEFGHVAPPAYLKVKLDEIELLAQARLNSNNTLQ